MAKERIDAMNRRWDMSLEEWARTVDSLVVVAAPGHLYALQGRSSNVVHRGEPVAAEHFIEPQWLSIHGFVIMRGQGEDRQVAANYMPTSADALQAGVPIVARNRVAYYDRNHTGAVNAAAEVVAFLNSGEMPTRPHGAGA